MLNLHLATFLRQIRLFDVCSEVSKLDKSPTFCGSDFRLYESSYLKTNLQIRGLGPGALAVCRAHWCLTVGFLLPRYSVLFTVESLSLLYLLFS